MGTQFRLVGVELRVTSLGSSAKVKFDRRPDRLSPARFDADIIHILDLLLEVRRLWEQAVDGGTYPDSAGLGGSRHTGFDDHDPTFSAVNRPTKRQLRGSARWAASEVAAARDRLDNAVDVLHRGLLRTDPEVLAEHLEKRRAATQ